MAKNKSIFLKEINKALESENEEITDSDEEKQQSK